MHFVSDLVATHGYAIVALAVGLESMGLPVPGETTLVTAAIYAGATGQLRISLVIFWAAVGAIAGDNAGFIIGRRLGYPVLLRYGRLLKLSERRITLGQYFFQRHGCKVVFFGRFVVALRALAALLAGVNCMPWRRFLMCNATGGIVWSTAYGLAAFELGTAIESVSGPLAAVLLTIAVLSTVALLRFVRRHEAALEDEAERAMRGPLRPA